MTELQIGLIGLGVAAVAGVVAYNTWQEYQHRKLAKKLLDAEHADVLLDGSVSGGADIDLDQENENAAKSRYFQERSDEPPMAIDPLVPMANERIEPVLRVERNEEPEYRLPVESKPANPVAAPAFVPSPVVTRTEDTKDSREPAEPLDLLSPAVDYLAALDVVEAAPAYQILESQRNALAQIQKPIHWVGYNEISREWEPIVDDGRSEYRRIRVGLQMVDRKGPVSEKDLSIFHVAMHDLADELMAIADMPLSQAALESAVQLDQFCASVDIQIGINVISTGQMFPGTKLRALAEAAGMVIDAEGCFVRCDDEGNVLYVLTNQEAPGFSAEAMKTMSTHGVTFLLDVPLVSHGERVFSQMLDLARRFADVLRGSLVDDNRRPLSEGALEPIRRQIGQCQTQMAARNLPAGGALAQRLFS